jgi:hypothetical protein
MKEVYINKHRCGCWVAENRKPDVWKGEHNSCLVRTDVFFVSPYFFILRINSCLQDDYESSVDFKLRIVESLFKKFSIVESHEIYKSCKKEYMQKFRSLSKFKTICKQVNYLYTNNANREYGIVTETSYFDLICDNQIIRNSYLQTIDKLKEIDEIDGVKDILIDRTKDLYFYNIHNEDDIQIVRTTDHLIEYINKLINNKINGNDKKSKLPRVIETHI